MSRPVGTWPPFIPGSSTEAFKGVSVFAGLLLTFGSSSVVSQAMIGLALMYARALREGDYVRIGETEGVVTAVGMLSTKIRTPKLEEVTLPSALVLGTAVKNFSRLRDSGGSVILTTSVTIGYDAPWRQVHALLIAAARKTDLVSVEPAPFVLQRALQDFYVEYELNVHTATPERRPWLLAELHRNIQDQFNTHGVQIMSPHYLGDPAQPKIVPKAQWFTPPADTWNADAVGSDTTAKPEHLTPPAFRADNRNSYLIIDVRPQSDYVLGHAENAINVEPKNLLEFIKSKDVNNYPKIVIISESGQSAAYYTALLRIGGFTKVYCMEYGMAVWHQNFADIWLNATRDFRTGSNNFTNEDYPKPDPTNLPKLGFENSNKSAKEKIEERINILLGAGFNEKLSDTSDFPKYNVNTLDDGQASIVVETIYRHYEYSSNTFTNYFIVSFGDNYLYKAHSLEGPFAGQGHLPSAVKYLPRLDLRSTNDLQTIPTNNIVALKSQAPQEWLEQFHKLRRLDAEPDTADPEKGLAALRCA